MRLQDIIIKPVITEKALGGNAQGVYVFKVNSAASKLQVKMAVEKLFNVEVAGVTSLISKGKSRRVGKKLKVKKIPDVKKVYVTLKKGSITLIPSAK